MSLDTPTTKEIRDNIVAQLEATLNQTIPLLPKSFLRVLANTLAAVFVLQYKYAGFMFLQMFVATASNRPTEVNGETVVPLNLWGQLIGVGDPAAATQAELVIDVTVENQTGTLPSNSQLLGPSNGVTYLTLGAVALNASTVQATVRASSDQSGGQGAGTIGNLSPGALLSFANPLPNVSRTAVVASQTVTGADGETSEAYRSRVVSRFQQRPQGGAYADYKQWAEEPAGVLTAYPYTGEFPGQVDVYVESATETDGIPTTAQLQEALDSIEFDSAGLASRRPAGALVNAFPIDRIAFDVQVVGLSVADEPQVQADIEAAVEEYFLGRDPFIVGLSILPRKDRITRSAVGGVVDDIVSAAGGIFSAVFVSRNTVNLDLYALDAGEKAKLGVLTFT